MFREGLPEQTQKAKIAFFEERSVRLEQRIFGLEDAYVQLGAWLEVLEGERVRLEKLKSQADVLIKGDSSLSDAWAQASQQAQKEAQTLEDQQALRAFMLLAHKYGSHGIEWKVIPAGNFKMYLYVGFPIFKQGSLRRVRVPSFLLSKTKVTVGQYRKCVEAGRCSEPDTGHKCNWGEIGREDHPINCVDWGQARTFAKWIGDNVDLSTEAEWEYAARGDADFSHIVTNDFLNGNEGTRGTEVVGIKRANKYGLTDMTERMWEWMLDEWHGSYSEAPSSGSQAWGSVPLCSQMCDKTSIRRVGRGYDSFGNYYPTKDDPKLSKRRFYLPDSRYNNLGFRLRRTIP